MNKKEFKSKCNNMKYCNSDKEATIIAIFFDTNSGIILDEVPEPYLYAKHIKYKKGDTFSGYKYCIYARAINATNKVLEDTLYNFIMGKIVDVPWYIQLVVAEKDYQRFRIPLAGSGLNTLIKFPS